MLKNSFVNKIFYFIIFGLIFVFLTPLQPYFPTYVIVGLTYFVSEFIQRLFERIELYYAAKFDTDLTHLRFLRHFIIGLLYIVGISLALSTIPVLHSVAVSLLASSGIAIAIIGFASKEVFSNVISGIFIQIFKPFSVGDYIIIKNAGGYVEDITLRHTILRSENNSSIVIPNNIINSDILENKGKNFR